MREAYSEHCQTSKMELFAKIVNSWKPLSIFAKSSILDVWQDSEYSSEILWKRIPGRFAKQYGNVLDVLQ